MPKKKPTKKQNLVSIARQNLLHGVLFLVLVVSLAGNALFVWTLDHNYLTNKTNAAGQAAFSIHPNQACNWQNLDELSKKFNLTVKRIRPHSLYGGIYKELPGIFVAQHICALSTDADAESESTLSTVKYFLNHDDAKNYAQKELEPKKYWSPGTKDDDLWRIMTYVTVGSGGTGRTEKVDAYTVKDDMLIEVTLPCTKLPDPGVCDNEARSYIDLMLKNLDETYGGKNQNPFRGITDVKY